MLRLISAAKLEEAAVVAGPLETLALGAGVTGTEEHPAKRIARKIANSFVFTQTPLLTQSLKMFEDKI
jgi:hypothetical protein